MDSKPVHLDASFLISALSSRAELSTLQALAESRNPIQMSAIAWYEFVRGPRTPSQLAAARSFLLENGVIAFTEELAWATGQIFRSFGSPRRRGADLAIAVTAIACDAALLTLNPSDFRDISGLKLL